MPAVFRTENLEKVTDEKILSYAAFSFGSTRECPQRPAHVRLQLWRFRLELRGMSHHFLPGFYIPQVIPHH